MSTTPQERAQLAAIDQLAASRERIVEAARGWYRSKGNAEAELAAAVQEYERLLKLATGEGTGS